MSHVQHQVICITSWDKRVLSECREKIININASRSISFISPQVTPIYPSRHNECSTFFVLPSGSKAGWPAAQSHLECIEEATRIIGSFAYDDGSNSISHSVAIYGESKG